MGGGTQIRQTGMEGERRECAGSCGEKGKKRRLKRRGTGTNVIFCKANASSWHKVAMQTCDARDRQPIHKEWKMFNDGLRAPKAPGRERPAPPVGAMPTLVLQCQISGHIEARFLHVGQNLVQQRVLRDPR